MTWWDRQDSPAPMLGVIAQISCRELLEAAVGRLYKYKEDIHRWTIPKEEILQDPERSLRWGMYNPPLDLSRSIPLEVLCMHDVQIYRHGDSFIPSPSLVHRSHGHSFFFVDEYGKVTCFASGSDSAKPTLKKFREITDGLRTFNVDVADAVKLEPKVRGRRAALLKQAGLRRHYDKDHYSETDEEVFDDMYRDNKELEELAKKTELQLWKHRPRSTFSRRKEEYAEKLSKLERRWKKNNVSKEVQQKELANLYHNVWTRWRTIVK
jgi:hypothetical protein